MAYNAYDPAKPDAATQNGTQFATSARNNFNALRDACIMGGGFFGFNLAVSGGTPEKPTQFLYSNGVERVRATVTWGVIGGEKDNVTSVTYAYSNNSGGNYTTTPNGSLGVKTITYDGSGNVLSTNWAP